MTDERDQEMSHAALALQELEGELNGMDARRRALVAAIASLKAVLRKDEQSFLPLPMDIRRGSMAGGAPVVPPGFFKGKTPTEAYRLLMATFPDDYRPPQIVDAFIAGGMEGERTPLLQSVHSVLKRARERAKKQSLKRQGTY